MPMRAVIIILILALISLQYKLWLGDGNVLHWYQLEDKIAIQKKENDKLLARNKALEADILELKSGEQALEEQARYELGMVKSSETYYQFTE